jgi:hypothetical protein
VRIVLEKDGSAAVELKPGWHIFNYASLPRTARADTTWVLHLVKTGWYKSSTVFREGVPIDIPPDAQPRWTFICYDERFTVRVAHRCRSDSIEDELLMFVTLRHQRFISTDDRIQRAPSSDRLSIPSVHGVSAVQARAISKPPRSPRTITTISCDPLPETLVARPDVR